MERTLPSLSKSLGSVRRQAVDLANYNPVRESQLNSDQPLPLLMEPASDQVDLADWARNNRDYINQKLQKHGGILFRGFNLKTPQDFEQVAAGIYNEIYSEYGHLPAKVREARSTRQLLIPKTNGFFITMKALT